MILSHKYKFIFFKTNKTAGTSIEIALSRFLGVEDVITPISLEDEKARKDLGHRGAQNYLAPLWNYDLRAWSDLLWQRRRKRRFYNHISAREVKTLIDEQVWSRYFKFCFERNPWDRVISLYYWAYPSEPRLTVSEFLESNRIVKLKTRGLHLYSIDGQVAVDKVCRYERLSEELETLRVQLGMPEPLDLPRAKSGYRADRRPYQELFNDRDKAKVAELFRDEIELWGYEF